MSIFTQQSIRLKKNDQNELPFHPQTHKNESQCYCEGQSFEKIPQNLNNLTKLSISNSKFKVLKEEGLRKYQSTLRDM
jgi:hypothetical protein